MILSEKTFDHPHIFRPIYLFLILLQVVRSVFRLHERIIVFFGIRLIPIRKSHGTCKHVLEEDGGRLFAIIKTGLCGGDGAVDVIVEPCVELQLSLRRRGSMLKYFQCFLCQKVRSLTSQSELPNDFRLPNSMRRSFYFPELKHPSQNDYNANPTQNPSPPWLRPSNSLIRNYI